MERFLIEKNANICDALIKIDKNKKGFLVVVDNENIVQGTITDGDLRRAFIEGITTTESIEKVYKTEFSYLSISDNLMDAIEMFKDSKIKFLPIMDENRKLINLITKAQLHSLLLQDIPVDLYYNFRTLDEEIVDHEIFLRPWGFYKTTVMNAYFQGKVIHIKPQGQLSLQSHNRREEHWIVAHGQGLVQLDNSKLTVQCGSSIFIPRGAKHRLINTSSEESLIVTEVQIGDYFGEDDIIRYEDIYGRG